MTSFNMIRLVSHSRRWPLILLVLFPCGIESASADDGATTRIRETIQIDELGDATIAVELQTPAATYTDIKSNTPNVAAMMRRLGWGQGWALVEDAQGTFNDVTSSIQFKYRVSGMGKFDGRQRWAVPIADGVNLDLIAQYDNIAILNGTANTDLGLTSHVVHCVLPEGAADVELVTNPDRLEFVLPPADYEGDRVAADFELLARPQLMSCLAKCYARPEFNLLWAARSVFENTGEQPIRDYRVRYRITGYSEWSGWNRTRTVLPGQTVVDPFFPLLDLEKVANLNSAVTTAIEVEYEYTTPDGEVVRDSDQRRVRLLSRNQVFFSSLDANDQVGWFDQFNYGPLLLSSFVTGNDPVIQQVAGIVSGRLGGINASESDEDAGRFLRDLFNFLSESGISYQTPPGGTFQGQFGQHIKYGRDVLRNRAGTCVDLAILYGSVCQAVGLDPVMILVPGHCYPAVKMPGGGYVPVEATLIGRGSFDDAIAVASDELDEFMTSKLGYLVDVQSQHDLGVDTLDLPQVTGDYLQTLGYEVTARRESRPDTATRQTSHHEATTGEADEPEAFAVVRVLNNCAGTVNYEIRYGNGEWQSHSVEQDQELHGGAIQRSEIASLPSIRIRFDYDLTDATQYWEYELEWSVVDAVNEQTIDSINGYEFFVDEDGWLDLAPVGTAARAAESKSDASVSAVFRIINPFDSPVYYQIRFGDGEWQSYSVDAHGLELHGGEISRLEAADLPDVRIRFDYDLSDEVVYREFTLHFSVLETVNDQTLETANGYRFAFDEENECLTLFTLNR